MTQLLREVPRDKAETIQEDIETELFALDETEETKKDPDLIVD